MKNLNVIIAVVILALIGLLSIRYFMQESAPTTTVPIPKSATK